jgi:hypothetical protein
MVGHGTGDVVVRSRQVRKATGSASYLLKRYLAGRLFSMLKALRSCVGEKASPAATKADKVVLGLYGPPLRAACPRPQWWLCYLLRRGKPRVGNYRLLTVRYKLEMWATASRGTRLAGTIQYTGRHTFYSTSR